jgi:hypothetical protein
MNFKIIAILVSALVVFTGCASNQEKEIDNKVGQNAVAADCLGSYYDLGDNGATYLTRQRHTYFIDSMGMKASAVEPSGRYQMSYSNGQISFDGKGGDVFWDTARAKLLASAFSVSNGYETPDSLKFEKSADPARIQGILYDVYTGSIDGSNCKLFARLSDGVIDRLELQADNKSYSVFCYNAFYEAPLAKVVMHNIDIYKGAAGSIDAKLLYSVEYTGF